MSYYFIQTKEWTKGMISSGTTLILINNNVQNIPGTFMNYVSI